MQKICKQCGSTELVKDRRLCKKCNTERVRILALARSKGESSRYSWTKICVACKQECKVFRKTSVICSECYKFMQKLSAETKSSGQYIKHDKTSYDEHRYIACQILGRKLETDEIVHHVNDNPKDNRRENLMVMSRSLHGKLHLHLNLERVIWEKSQNENHENCWNTLIVPITTAWLEMTSANVIKIWEIGQSAAEPLNSKEYGEGSETMHVTS